MWCWRILRLFKFKCRQKFVDKFVEECSANIDEVEMEKITLAEHENEYENVSVLAHCTLCYFQQSVQSTLESVLLSFNFIYYKYINPSKKVVIIKMVLVFKH